ncbi:MAG: primosomal protein N' [Firmicutes bacterium]|nr:primosomal protein N' [Bacillota bacterium]
METQRLVEVAVDIRSQSFWGTYTYSVPGSLEGRVTPGSVVVVPFGSRRVRGFVVRYSDLTQAVQPPQTHGTRHTPPLEGEPRSGTMQVAGHQIKGIISVVEPNPALGPEMMGLAQAVAAEYCSPVQMALRAMLPPAMAGQSRRLVGLAVDEAGVEALSGPLTPAEASVVDLLVDEGERTPAELAEATGLRDIERVLRTLRVRGIVRVETVFKAPRGVRMAWEASLAREVTQEELSVLSGSAPRRAELLKVLIAEGRPMAAAEAVRRSGAGQSSLKALEKAGLVRLERVRASTMTGTVAGAILGASVGGVSPGSAAAAATGGPAPGHSMTGRLYRPQPLGEAHERVAAELIQQVRDGGRAVLLVGGTAAERTGVYAAIVDQLARGGRNAIVLVPEIALTPRRRLELSSRFAGSVVMLHSGLPAGERYAHWKRIAEGDVDVVVGTRSAVFAPVPRLAAIIVDDEHHEGYKQTEGSPRYNARDVALMRSMRQGGTVILGSATPSVESYYHASNGAYGILQVPESSVHLRPACHTVDMREELKRGNRSLLSLKLQDEVHSALSSDKRAVLFLNRRGFSSFVLCRECGFSLRCPNCDVTYTYHRPGVLKCHYCGHEEPAPDVCPKCGGRRVRPFGAGTQRVEEEVRRLFPDARVVRVDLDTASRRSSYDALVRGFAEGKANVLVCTQMVLGDEGLPHAAVAGVLSADLTLNLPDFRSAERTYQLLSQVIAISGGPESGVAVIQSYDPSHYCIQAACTGDYRSFYTSEIEGRRESGYPPFGHLANVVIWSPGDAVARALAKDAARHLRTHGGGGFELLGPGPAPFPKLRGWSRWQMLMKGPSRIVLAEAARGLSQALERKVRAARSRLTVDVDPVSML